MILSVPSMFPRADRIHVVRDNETETWRSDYTERKAGVPQLLLVEQQIPGSAILPHFHGIDQFQIVIDGDGRIGNHKVAPVSVHYTNQYTGYGPIVAGERGVSYFVLRPGFDVMGSQYLHWPGSREKLKAGHKRFFMVDRVPLADAASLGSLAAASTQRLIGVPADDPDAGVFADLLQLAPGMAWTAPDPAAGGGQVVLVLQGSLEYDGRDMGLRSAIAVTRGEPAITLRAGAAGMQALVLQYPRRLAA